MAATSNVNGASGYDARAEQAAKAAEPALPNNTPSIAPRRDFATVLNDVVRAGDKPPGDRRENNQPSRSNTSATDDAGREKEVDRPPVREPERLTRNKEPQAQMETREDDGLAGALVVNQPQPLKADNDVASAQAILPVADMERILAAVRTQVLPGGNREVTLDLQRSVLDGLRIRLTADPRGRIGVEFLAPSAAVKGQVDARAGELADMFRANGVKLDTLHSSINNASADSNQGHSRQRPEQQYGADKIDNSRRPASPVTDDGDAGPEFYNNATYRA